MRFIVRFVRYNQLRELFSPPYNYLLFLQEGADCTVSQGAGADNRGMGSGGRVHTDALVAGGMAAPREPNDGADSCD